MAPEADLAKQNITNLSVWDGTGVIVQLVEYY